MPLVLAIADITTLDVDGIVNAANTSLLGGGGVDGAIHRAAGPDLLEECRKLRGCATGDAKSTKGYRLKARYVIHTVGPVWHGGRAGEDDLLASCYEACFREAKKLGVSSIAFPSVSTGAYGFPVERAAVIAAKAFVRMLDERPDFSITLAAFDERTFRAYEQVRADLRL